MNGIHADSCHVTIKLPPNEADSVMPATVRDLN